MGDLSEHFSAKEFACHCGCGGVRVELVLLQALEDIRAMVNAPIIVVSGYRCLAHNTRVGGAKKSFHMQGIAADIKTADMAALYLAALKVPAIKGIGIYLRPGGWIHVDTRRDPARWAQDGLKRPMDFNQAAKILCERKGETENG